MIIKLTESQLINIVENVSVDDTLNKFGDTVDQLADLWQDDLPDAWVAAMLDHIQNNPEDSNLSQEELIRKLGLRSGETYLTDDEFQLPLQSYKLTSPYGPRNIGGSASRNHKGVDLGVPVGSKIFSPADGVVVKSKNAGGKCGGFLKIKHDNGLQTKYCHLSNFSIVSKGQRVQKGQLVGLSGGAKGSPYAGNSMGPHVHYEVLRGKTHIDPASVHRFS
jgi:murein DD-endopeptidase MepM/ murein hydrolase activator NlpD